MEGKLGREEFGKEGKDRKGMEQKLYFVDCVHYIEEIDGPALTF